MHNSLITTRIIAWLIFATIGVAWHNTSGNAFGKPLRVHRNGEHVATRDSSVDSIDSLIALGGGLFAFCGPTDQQLLSNFPSSLAENTSDLFFRPGSPFQHRKWGICDSSRKIIVPCIADAVSMADSAGTGRIAVVTSCIPLPTGLPRNDCHLKYVFFDKTGLLPDSEYEIRLTLAFFSCMQDPCVNFEEQYKAYFSMGAGYPDSLEKK